MNIDLALEKIYSLKQFHVKLGLDNITNLLNQIGNPQNILKIFHVAGSNGKGSTCSFLASILQEYGFKIGLYTSPHFVNFNERIRINGTPISDEYIIEFLEKNKKYIDEKKPTFFEITTALAYEYFKYSKVDYAIIETGLGGRLDATNTIKPLASIITSISLEHSHILGNTLEKIAYEKSGIIKQNIPVFIGILSTEATQTIKKIAADKNCALFCLDETQVELTSNIEIGVAKKSYKINNVGLKGNHQQKNAALAVKALQNTLRLTDYKLIDKGLDNVVANTGIQGRYERFSKTPNIILDAAHNLEGVSSFIHEFKKEFDNYKNRILIFGAMKDKDIGKMLSMLIPFFTKIYVTSTNYERAATSSEIKQIANENNIMVEETYKPNDIICLHQKSGIESCLVILGSIYLLGDIKRKLNS